jgi:hypothetical protein
MPKNEEAQIANCNGTCKIIELKEDDRSRQMWMKLQTQSATESFVSFLMFGQTSTAYCQTRKYMMDYVVKTSLLPFRYSGPLPKLLPNK